MRLLRVFPVSLYLLAALAGTLGAQEIRIYSEFERFDAWGNPVRADRDLVPREILSPAVPRNGHASFHVVVTTPPGGTNFFLYAVSNPPGILELHLYREHWTRCGESVCADWLSLLPNQTFGAIPESLTENRTQTTRNYLLDIYVPKGVPPRRVRVEALLKVGIWYIAPMEVRVIEPVIPETAAMPKGELLAPTEAPSSATALLQLLRYQTCLGPVLPPSLVRVRDFIQRNAAEDMALAQSYRRSIPEFSWLMFSPFTFPELGAEWYLRVRDFLYRYEQ